MSYQVDRTAQLKESVAKSRFGSVAALRAAGTPTAQHNVGTTKKVAKKVAAKKAVTKKTAAKKAVAPKSSAKKTTKKS